MSKNHLTHYSDITEYKTKDGSIICELMHPDHHKVKQQSLAEAIIPIDTETELHKHNSSEEIYHITQGEGLMTLGNDNFSVKEGDTICIEPGMPHKIRNTAKIELKILCCCSPTYSHEDTVLL